MSQLNDCQFTGLTGQGFSGALNDMMLAWLQSQGVAATQLNDAWSEFLLAQGVTPGSVNDMMFEWLTGLGYTGQLNDMELEFWCVGGGVVGPGVTRLVIPDDSRDTVIVTFNGAPGGTLNGGVTFTVDGGGAETFTTATPGPGPNDVTYTASSDFQAEEVVRWLYTPGNITVGGEALPSQDKLVDNQIATLPQYVSGRVYSVDSSIFVEVTFNVRMNYTDFNGVTIKADGNARAITGISGIGTNKITYTTANINHLNAVTWEYLASAGNLENESGDPLGDVTPQTVQNQVATQTFWDLIPPATPGTFWDDTPPDETRWDLET